jgi:ribosomal protein S18 acetylase RimI-like enzyme
MREAMPDLDIRPLADSDRDWVARLITEHWASSRVVSRGRVHDVRGLPGFVATQDGERVGVLTYRVEGDECEIVTLNSLSEGKGVGSALIDAASSVAHRAGCRRLWLITTNDNVSVLRFYQKRGFVLVAIHRNAMDEVRRLKPGTPLVGLDGIPLRDEIELEMLLDG